MKKYLMILTAALIGFAFGGSAEAQSVSSAIAVIQSVKGNGIHGTVVFKQEDSGVKADVAISGLKPGKHGFHVGDLSKDDGSSAGSHFNPGEQPHGGPADLEHHMGDLGNITADSKGNVKTTISIPEASLTGSSGILGRSVVVHKHSDDYKSQPAGNSGDRIAWGVIGIMQE